MLMLFHRLAAEIVEGDVFWFNTQIVQHFEDRLVHHRWSADVVLDVFGSRVDASKDSFPAELGG